MAAALFRTGGIWSGPFMSLGSFLWRIGRSIWDFLRLKLDVRRQAFFPDLPFFHFGVVNGPDRLKGNGAFSRPSVERKGGKYTLVLNVQRMLEIQVEYKVQGWIGLMIFGDFHIREASIQADHGVSFFQKTDQKIVFIFVVVLHPTKIT